MSTRPTSDGVTPASSRRPGPTVRVDPEPCPRCGGTRVSLDALEAFTGYLWFCRCSAGYAISSLDHEPTSYCISLECPCKAAGRSRGGGSLTGRARWYVSAPGSEYPQSTEITLCGSCYRAIRDVLSPRLT